MKNKLKITAYLSITSFIIANGITGLVVTVKESACDGIMPAVPEFHVYQGPCASDGNAYAALGAVIFVVTIALMLFNLWLIKRLKL